MPTASATRAGTPPKCVKARTCPTRKLNWSWRSQTQAKPRPDYISRIRKSHALRPRAIEIDQHLEEVDVGEIPWAIRQRHRDLATLALPLGYGLFHERHADSMSLGHEQLVQPRRRQPLLARGPLDRLGE